MIVYVDDAKNPYGRMLMSHMVADTEQELHIMAQKIGLKRDWYQIGRYSHYDLCQSKRLLALNLGAVEVSQKELIAIVKRKERI